MRLIDANELTKKVNHILASQFITGGSYVLDEIINAIKTMPTVEQKHGRWIKEECRDVFDRKHTLYKCSNCNKRNIVPAMASAFCARCGAKMDEVTE